ncbi:MAG: GIY-YIG nuclease family protein [Patescibacteria group bacterium]
MFFYVYVLESLREKKSYIGSTVDLNRRLKEHNSGNNFSTKPFRPWQLVHIEGYRDQEDALRRERYLKTNQGSRAPKRMLKEYFYKRSRKIN